MTNDTISRAAVVDTIEGVDWYHQNKNGEMVHGANSDEHQAWYKAEDIYKAIEALPPAQPDIPDMNVIIDTIKNAINASTGNDAYMVGLRNGMKWCWSALTDKEPEYEDIPFALPPATDTNVGGTDTISRSMAIDAFAPYAEYESNRTNKEWVRRINMVLSSLPSAQPVEDVRAMCGECDAWNKYKNYPQPEQFNPCTVCQEFDCTGCKFRRT